VHRHQRTACTDVVLVLDVTGGDGGDLFITTEVERAAGQLAALIIQRAGAASYFRVCVLVDSYVLGGSLRSLEKTSQFSGVIKLSTKNVNPKQKSKTMKHKIKGRFLEINIFNIKHTLHKFCAQTQHELELALPIRRSKHF